MPPSNPSVFVRSSNSWDTGYARKFLLIPKEELKVFNNISENPTPQQKISQKHSSKIKVGDRIAEVLSIPQLKKPEKAVNQFRSIIENSNIKVALVQTSDFLQEKRLELPLVARKHPNLDSIPLYSRTIEVSSVISEKRLSSSTPDVQTVEGISFRMSTEHHTFSKSDKLQQLNTTYTVPTVLDDKTNSTQTIFDEPYKIISKKREVFEKFARQVSNQSILEEPSSPNVPKFGGLPVFSTNPVQKPVDCKNFLSKKLKLLEKRFSPSKEFSLVSSSEENFKTKPFFKNKFEKMNTSVLQPDNILVSQVNVSSPNEVFDKEIKSSKAVLNSDCERATSPFSCIQNPEKTTSMQKELLVEIQPSQKKCTEEIPLKSKTSVFEEESFISQSFPCGQLPSNTQFSVKSLPNISETQFPIEYQDVESTAKINVAEKVNMPSDVFYEKLSGQVQVNDSVSIKDKSGGKRKRKSKGDKPSKKLLDAKSLVCIQYTAKQVQDMIEIIRHFQFEKKICI